MKIKFKKNNISYGQDFSFFKGVPEGIVFSIEKFSDASLRLIADGYGNLKGNYGNGAIYVSVTQFPEKYIKILKKKFNFTTTVPCSRCGGKGCIELPL